MTSKAQNRLQSEIEERIALATRLLVDAAKPEKVILFGSYARGDAGEDSDLDFLVIVPKLEDRLAEMVRLTRVLSPLRFPVDVMVYSHNEVEDRGQLPGTALRWALEEGKVLYAAP